MKHVTPQEGRKKIERYCAYQERHHQEVRQKLFSYGLYKDDVEEIITSLITDGFLNEERYAKAYAGGKFRMKKWGRLKITNALENKGLSNNCIRLGMKEIDEADYLKTLHQILEHKAKMISDENLYVKRDKLSKFAIAKGYEPDLTWKMIRALLPD
jgi:regulatory protein